MIKVKVGGTELAYDSVREVEESRILGMISALRREGQPVCVLVTVEQYPVDLLLPAGACTGMSNGVRRPLKPEEQRIIEVWERHKLNRADFHEGELIAFLKQLRRLLDS